MKKLIVIILAAIILVVGGVTYYGIKNLDSIVKNVIETVGTKVTGTTVSLSGVSIKLKEGRGELTGFDLANPPGFDSEHVFHLNEVALDIKPNSLLGDVIVIDEVLIDGADIIAEQKGQQTNLQVLIENIKKHASGTSDEPAEPVAEGGEPIRLAITKFSFINNSAQLLTETWEPQVLNVPDIEMANLGSADDGLTPEQLSVEVVNRLVRSVEDAAKDALKKKAEEEAKKALSEQLDKNLSEDAKNIFKKLSGGDGN